MSNEIMWEPWGGEPGSERLCLEQSPCGIVAESAVTGIYDEIPFSICYTIRCDAAWRVCAVSIVDSDGATGLTLLTDSEGYWTDADGTPQPQLQDCIAVEISATPFTKTLPIRRLGLQPGASESIQTIYIAIPSLRRRVVRQRYTCLAADDGGSTYLYESLTNGFSVEFDVDADGVVLDYPGAFVRAWPHAEWL